MYFRLYYIFCEADSSTYVGMRVGNTVKKTYDVDLQRSKEFFVAQNVKKQYYKKLCKKFEEFPLTYFKIHFDTFVSDNKDKVLDRMQLTQTKLGKHLLNDTIFDNEKVECEECGLIVRKKILGKHQEKCGAVKETDWSRM